MVLGFTVCFQHFILVYVLPSPLICPAYINNRPTYDTFGTNCSRCVVARCLELTTSRPSGVSSTSIKSINDATNGRHSFTRLVMICSDRRNATVATL